MELTTLNSNISNGISSPYYIFTGLETTIRDIYINQISETFNLRKIYVDSVGAAFLGNQKNLFNENRLYIVKEDKDLLTNEALIKKLKAYDGKNSIIICYTIVDKRKTFYKQFEDEIVWFNYLEEDKLLNYVKRELPTGNNDFYKDIIYICDNDYGRILLVINIIQLYSKLNETTPQHSFYELVSRGVIYVPKENKIFELTDNLMEGKFLKVIKDIDIYDPSENIKNLAALHTAIRNHYLVRSSNGKTKDLTVPPFLINKIKKSRQYFSIQSLEESMNLIMETVHNIIKGKIDNNIAFKYVVLKIMTKE